LNGCPEGKQWVVTVAAESDQSWILVAKVQWHGGDFESNANSLAVAVASVLIGCCAYGKHRPARSHHGRRKPKLTDIHGISLS
jgi:hypothetical protein